jgi:hyperosmotically inducible protein
MQIYTHLRLLALGAVVSSFALITGQQPPASDSAPAADNTKMNKRDRSKSEVTADQGKNNKLDRDAMQKIRKSIMSDKSLSMYAHNVKVISDHGKVTLKGPVHSEEEKQAVEAKATEVAGAGNVTNQVTVMSDKGNQTK